MPRRPRCAAANATRHESHPTSAAYPRPRPCVARNGSGAGRARWRRRCRSRARCRRTMPPPRTRASPAAPSRSAACTAPLPAFEGLAGGASPPSDRPSSSHRRALLCVRLLPATWYLARRQTDGELASLWQPANTQRHVGAWHLACRAMTADDRREQPTSTFFIPQTVPGLFVRPTHGCAASA